MLGKIMDVISGFKASIRAFNISEKEKNHVMEYEINARILVPSTTELDKVVSQISFLQQVKSVRRV